jgi:hypothetical protein
MTTANASKERTPVRGYLRTGTSIWRSTCYPGRQQRVCSRLPVISREEFGLKHRYALILHADEPHPHVHLVVKAVSEQGMRLHTTPATLREWRREFARHLREQGIAAMRLSGLLVGRCGRPRKTVRTGEPTRRFHPRTRMESVAAEVVRGDLQVEPGKSLLYARIRNRSREICSREFQPHKIKRDHLLARTSECHVTQRTSIAGGADEVCE